MSLQGPAWPRCVRRRLFVGSQLRRPCIHHVLLLVIALSVSPAEAACHHFRIWKFPKPQKCFTALAPFHQSDTKRASHILETSHERIDVPLPDLEFTPCPEGDERFQAIAKLRALMDAR